MKLIGLLTSAIVVYALVAACVLWPGNAHSGNEQARAQMPGTPGNFPGSNNPDPRHKPAIAQRGHVSVEGLPYRAITMQIQRPDWMDKYKHSLDEIVSVGADTVKLVVDSRQENGRRMRLAAGGRLIRNARPTL